MAKRQEDKIITSIDEEVPYNDFFSFPANDETGETYTEETAVNEEKPSEDVESSSKNTPETGAFLVCKGAICKCSVGSALAFLKITSHRKFYVNDTSGSEKLVATIKDVSFEEPAFVSCSAKNNAKCTPKATEWMIKAGEEHPEAGGNKILTQNGELLCAGGGGTIQIIAHGQTQTVTDIDTEDYSIEIAPAVNCLAPTDEITAKGDSKEKAASVETLVFEGQSSNNNPDIIIRKNRQVIFEAKPGKVKSPNVLDTSLISWSICTRKADEKIPNLKATNPTTFSHYGERFPTTFKKAGCYFIEGYGRPMVEYKYAAASKGCVFQIEVVDKNSIRNIKVAGTDAEFTSEDNMYLLLCGTDAIVEIETLLPLEEEEIFSLHAMAVNKENNVIVNFFPQVTKFKFPVKDEALFELSILFGEEKKSVFIGGITNEVAAITPSVGILRPKQQQPFTAKLKHKEKTIDLNRIEWYVNGLFQRKGENFSFYTSSTGKITLEAFIRPSWSFTGKGKRVAKQEFTVKKCEIISLTPIGNHPPNDIPIYIGKSIALEAKTDFPNYSTDMDGDVQWNITLQPKDRSENSVYDAEIAFLDGHKGSEEMRPGELHKSFKAKRSIFIMPFRPGKYTVAASLNGSKKSVVLHVKKGEILRWCFTDGNNNRRKHIGWRQDFYIAVHVDGWKDLEGKINLWIDRRKEKRSGNGYERFNLLPCKETEAKVMFDGEGKIQLVLIKGNSDLWDHLEEKIKKFEIKENIRLSFTMEKMPVKCKGIKVSKNYEQGGSLYGQIFPAKETSETGGSIDVLYNSKTAGYFADADNEKLKRIIRYGEPAKAVIHIMQGRSDYGKSSLPDYFFTLTENRKTKDAIIIDKERLPAPDDEGQIIFDIDTINKNIKAEEHEKIMGKGKSCNPRVFYFSIFEKRPSKDFKLLFSYPENYGNEKKNNDFLVELHPDAKIDDQQTAEKAADNANKVILKGKQNYFLQLKIAKDTTLNRTLAKLSPIVIGEGLERKKEEKCACEEYDLVWGNKVTCEFRKKVVQICSELWGESKKMEMANGLMACMYIETGGSFKAQQLYGWKSVHNPAEMTIAHFRLNKERKSSRAVGLIQFTQTALEILGDYKSNKNLPKEERFDELNRVKLRYAKMGEIAQLDKVKAYFEKPKNKITRLEDIYVHIFASDGVGKSDSHVLYVKGTDEYKLNAAMDGNANGKIEVGEVREKFRKSYDKGSEKINRKIKNCSFKNTSQTNNIEWHDPVDNPRVNKYNSNGNKKPESAAFGNARIRKKPFHSGIDLFAIPGKDKVYSCLDGTIVQVRYSDSAGWIIRVKIKDVKKLLTQEKSINYKLSFNKELWGCTIKESDTVYLVYMHLHSCFFTKEDADNKKEVKAGTALGYAGVSGSVAKGTHAPHLHFEITTIFDPYGKGDSVRANPARFIKLNSWDTKDQDNENKPHHNEN